MLRKRVVKEGQEWLYEVQEPTGGGSGRVLYVSCGGVTVGANLGDVANLQRAEGVMEREVEQKLAQRVELVRAGYAEETEPLEGFIKFSDGSGVRAELIRLVKPEHGAYGTASKYLIIVEYAPGGQSDFFSLVFNTAEERDVELARIWRDLEEKNHD